MSSGSVFLPFICLVHLSCYTLDPAHRCSPSNEGLHVHAVLFDSFDYIVSGPSVQKYCIACGINAIFNRVTTLARVDLQVVAKVFACGQISERYNGAQD